jgi:hypothetical protein
VRSRTKSTGSRLVRSNSKSVRTTSYAPYATTRAAHAAHLRGLVSGDRGEIRDCYRSAPGKMLAPSSGFT